MLFIYSKYKSRYIFYLAQQNFYPNKCKFPGEDNFPFILDTFSGKREANFLKSIRICMKFCTWKLQRLLSHMILDGGEGGDEKSKKPTAWKPKKTKVFRIFIELSLPFHTSSLSKCRTSRAELRLTNSGPISLYLEPDRFYWHFVQVS